MQLGLKKLCTTVLMTLIISQAQAGDKVTENVTNNMFTLKQRIESYLNNGVYVTKADEKNINLFKDKVEEIQIDGSRLRSENENLDTKQLIRKFKDETESIVYLDIYVISDKLTKSNIGLCGKYKIVRLDGKELISKAFVEYKYESTLANQMYGGDSKICKIN